MKDASNEDRRKERRHLPSWDFHFHEREHSRSRAALLPCAPLLSKREDIPVFHHLTHQPLGSRALEVEGIIPNTDGKHTTSI